MDVLRVSWIRVCPLPVPAGIIHTHQLRWYGCGGMNWELDEFLKKEKQLGNVKSDIIKLRASPHVKGNSEEGPHLEGRGAHIFSHTWAVCDVFWDIRRSIMFCCVSASSHSRVHTSWAPCGAVVCYVSFGHLVGIIIDIISVLRVPLGPYGHIFSLRCRQRTLRPVRSSSRCVPLPHCQLRTIFAAFFILLLWGRPGGR